MALTDSLRAYYTFDGVMTDSTGNGHTLAGGSPTYSSGGVINQYLNSSSGSTATYPASDTARSLAFWVKPSGASTENAAISWDGSTIDALGINITDAVDVTAILEVQFIGISTTIPTAAWSHIAAVVSGSNVLLYVNGVLNDTQPHNFGAGWSSGTFTANADAAAIGIDEMGVWQRVLTAAEVVLLYNGGFPPDYPFTIATATHAALTWDRPSRALTWDILP
jgi:concanavalin A-like lectin/glucanase superfamily protein